MPNVRQCLHLSLSLALSLSATTSTLLPLLGEDQVPSHLAHSATRRVQVPPPPLQSVFFSGNAVSSNPLCPAVISLQGIRAISLWFGLSSFLHLLLLSPPGMVLPTVANMHFIYLYLLPPSLFISMVLVSPWQFVNLHCLPHYRCSITAAVEPHSRGYFLSYCPSLAFVPAVSPDSNVLTCLFIHL